MNYIGEFLWRVALGCRDMAQINLTMGYLEFISGLRKILIIYASSIILFTVFAISSLASIIQLQYGYYQTDNLPLGPAFILSISLTLMCLVLIYTFLSEKKWIKIFHVNQLLVSAAHGKTAGKGQTTTVNEGSDQQQLENIIEKVVERAVAEKLDKYRSFREETPPLETGKGS